MKTALCACVVAGALLSASEAQTPAASEVYGTWRVVRIKATGVVTQGEARTQALVGTRLVIAKDRVIEADEPPCKVVPPYPIVRVVKTADEVPLKAAPSPAAAGLPETAVLVDTGCLAVFVVDERHLVFEDRGAYYSAERIGN